MPKTITLRLQDDAYTMVKTAAESQHRSISNFMEWATFSYLTNVNVVDDKEMEEIIHHHGKNLRKARADYKKGKYHIVG